jgi:hypothetical protein
MDKPSLVETYNKEDSFIFIVESTQGIMASHMFINTIESQI